MRRLFTLAFLIFGLTACVDVVGPEPREEVAVSLPPFSWPTPTIEVGLTYAQTLSFYAPIGVAPQIILIVEDISNPSPMLETSMRLEMGLDEVCTPNCSRTTWRLTVLFKANGVGKATISVFDQSNAGEKVSFRVIASNSTIKG